MLFEARMPWGTVEVLGIPFEYVGRQWAIHMAVNDNALWPRWVVSDVQTGAKLPGIVERNSAEARKAAVAVLDATDKDKLKKAISKLACQRATQSPGRQRSKGSQTGAATVTA